jgi:hypothetical protein
MINKARYHFYMFLFYKHFTKSGDARHHFLSFHAKNAGHVSHRLSLTREFTKKKKEEKEKSMYKATHDKGNLSESPHDQFYAAN